MILQKIRLNKRESCAKWSFSGKIALAGGLAEWQCAGLENRWAKALAGSSPAPTEKTRGGLAEWSKAAVC